MSTDWLQFVQPIGTLLIGIAACSIALRQWITAHEKLRLDLLPLRIKIFEETMLVLNKILRKEDTEFDFNDFLKASYRTEMLFGDDVVKIINDLRQSVSEIHYAAKFFSAGGGDQQEMRNWQSRYQRGYLDIGSDHERFRKVVSKYIRFEIQNTDARLIQVIQAPVLFLVRNRRGRKE